MEEKILGKISEIYFGKRDGRIGLFLTLSGVWGVSTSYETWDPQEVEVDDGAMWTELDRKKELIEIMEEMSKLMAQAKVNNINDLKNMPVEMTAEGMTLKSWRILEEVL